MKTYFFIVSLILSTVAISAQCTDPTLQAEDCDFDGDGIINLTDIDDDNDGILDTVENSCPSRFAEITSSNTGSGSTSVNMIFPSGVTLFGAESTSANFNATITDNSSCLFGGIHFFEGEIDSDQINVSAPSGSSQITFTFSEPVTNYRLHIDGLDRRRLTISGTGVTGITLLNSNTSTTVSGFTIFDNTPSTIHTSDCSDQTNSVEGSFEITGTYSSFTFNFSNNGSTSGDGFTMMFSEPFCPNSDYDMDNYPNQFDLDSDGDGCPDIQEALVLQYIETNSIAATLTSGTVVNPSGTTTENNVRLDPSNNGDLTGPNNGFYDTLESATPGVYDGTYDISTYYLDDTKSICVCYRFITNFTVSVTENGISTLSRNLNNGLSSWPLYLSSGYLALDSKEKGLVLTRLSQAEIDLLTPSEGMLLYNTDSKCLFLYDGMEWFCIQQTCIDN